MAFSTCGAMLRKRLASLLTAKSHDAFHASTIVPTAVEDHDLATAAHTAEYTSESSPRGGSRLK